MRIKDIAEFTLLYFLENGISICPLKLQKILYYIQAWHMVYFDKALLFDDKPEAWVNGPVYRSIYNQFKHIGIYDQITNDNVDLKLSLKEMKEKLMLDDDQESFLEAIYCNYGTMSHDKLVFLTHSEKPWSEKREGLSPFDYSDEELSIDTMYSYYKERIDKKKK
ncbi:Panacea domain-containing protein [Bacteroides finegoldii]|uniref:Panacea domain-containing protein n=1 Tax=Bacteroides finegoldii TaxID=338188 RepID=UPI0018A01F74|nr:type II toxin-antitoxin system antitoxin SocA domain-containing protein [Bacteroides finegoldii]